MATLTTRGTRYPGLMRRSGSLGWAIVLIVAGAAAIALPMLAGMSLLLIFAAVLLIGGVAHGIYSLATRGVRSFAWHAAIALVYIGAAIYMMVEPATGLATLAMVLAVLFMFEGGMLIGAWWVARRMPLAGWLLANGLLSLLLGLLMLTAWPQRSGELLGLLIGVNLLFAGVTRLVYRPAVSPGPP